MKRILLTTKKKKKNFQFNVFQKITIFHSKIQTNIKLWIYCRFVTFAHTGNSFMHLSSYITFPRLCQPILKRVSKCYVYLYHSQRHRETSWDSILHNLVWKIHRVATTLAGSGKVVVEKFHVRKRFFFSFIFPVEI